MKFALIKKEEDNDRYRNFDPNQPLEVHGVIICRENRVRTYPLYLCKYYRKGYSATLDLTGDEEYFSFCGKPRLRTYRDTGKRNSTENYMWIRDSHLHFLENNASAKGVLTKWEG